MYPSRHLQGMKSAFGSGIEMIGLAEVFPHGSCLAASQFDGLFIAHRKPQGFLTRLLGNHCDGDRSPQSLVKVAHEAISNAEQLVGSGAGHSDLDSALEASPEGSKIFIHDRQSSESEGKGYSSASTL